MCPLSYVIECRFLELYFSQAIKGKPFKIFKETKGWWTDELRRAADQGKVPLRVWRGIERISKAHRYDYIYRYFKI